MRPTGNGRVCDCGERMLLARSAVRRRAFWVRLHAWTAVEGVQRQTSVQGWRWHGISSQYMGVRVCVAGGVGGRDGGMQRQKSRTATRADDGEDDDDEEAGVGVLA